MQANNSAQPQPAYAGLATLNTQRALSHAHTNSARESNQGVYRRGMNHLRAGPRRDDHEHGTTQGRNDGTQRGLHQMRAPPLVGSAGHRPTETDTHRTGRTDMDGLVRGGSTNGAMTPERDRCHLSHRPWPMAHVIWTDLAPELLGGVRLFVT